MEGRILRRQADSTDQPRGRWLRGWDGGDPADAEAGRSRSRAAALLLATLALVATSVAGVGVNARQGLEL